MIRIIDNKEVKIICLNEECHYWDNTSLYFCSKYESTSEIIDCIDGRFKAGFMGVVKP